MKVVLYIGHHKVGSTALQQFLAQNSHRLLQSGILYPAVDSEGLSYMLARAIKGTDTVEDLPMNVREPHNALAYRMWNHRKGYTVPPYHSRLPSMHQMQFFLENQIKMLAPHTVILCSEVMSNFGRVDLFLIDKMRTMFGSDVELEIYCALRRPDEYVTAWYGQQLRFGDKLDALRDGGFKKYIGGMHFNFEIMLRPWVERCTKATFSIRSYGEIVANGGSLKDFFDQTNVPLPPDMLEAPRINTSYPLALYEVIRRANHALDRETSETLKNYLVFIADELDLPPNAQIEMFGQANREIIYNAFLPVEDWLRSVTDKPAFFEDLDQVLVPRPQAEVEVIPETIDKIQRRKIGPGLLPETALEVLKTL